MKETLLPCASLDLQLHLLLQSSASQVETDSQIIKRDSPDHCFSKIQINEDKEEP